MPKEDENDAVDQMPKMDEQVPDKEPSIGDNKEVQEVD